MPITAIELTLQIPWPHQAFFRIQSQPLDDKYKSVCDALVESINLFLSKAKIHRAIYIVLEPAPFTLNLSNGDLIYKPKNDQIINVHIDDSFIYLDYEKMSKVKYEHQMACILEELVHALMGVTDEILVSQVVCMLYPKLQCGPNGEYLIV